MEPDWSKDDEEQAKKLAQKVVDRGMALPAILFLESVRPLHFIGSQFVHFMAPISGLVVGRWDLDRLGNFLEHRGAVPFVIEEIQQREKQRADAAQANKKASKALKAKKTLTTGDSKPGQAIDGAAEPPESDDSRRT